ncbi:MAG TPA: SpoIID/LytB domain-containing protein [Gaiellaceae bacterium]
MVRRSLAVAVLLALLTVGAASARQTAPAGSGPVFVFTGHGWGHGVGMSQYGAYGFAQHGWTYDQIVTHYFPGTTLGPAPTNRIRVLLASGRGSLTIASSQPFSVRDGTGASHDLEAGSYRFGPGLKLKTAGVDAPQPLTPPLTFLPGAAPLQLGALYRGSLQVDVIGGMLRAINVVGLEQYLYGVVPSEMPYKWAPEALKAQAVVARSFALSGRKASAPYDVYPDTRSQVYLGYSHERPSTNAAVDATAGQVLLYQGQVARTFFFSTSGGRTENVGDVFSGGADLPYLVSVADPYDSISPYHDWGPYTYTGAKLAKAFKMPGAVTDLQAALNGAGRIATLKLISTKGEVDVAGPAVRTALGLRSTWFTFGELGLVPPATATPVVYGSSVQLMGVVRGMDGVTLEQRALGQTWQQVSAVTPAADGTVAVVAKPEATTEYRLVTSTLAAGSIRIAVAPRVTFSDRQPGELRGLVRPVLPGAPVQLQRQDGTRWRTIQSGRVDESGGFDLRLQLTDGTYRARVAPGHGFAAGTTPPLRVISG